MVERYKARVLCIAVSAQLRSALSTLFEASELLEALFVNRPDALFTEMQDSKPILAIIEDIEGTLDGLSIVQSIRRSEQSPNIRLPTLLIFNETTYKRVLAASDAGANHILTAPFTSQECWESIEDTLTDERPFVETKQYVGPERRGPAASKFGGSDRRTNR